MCFRCKEGLCVSGVRKASVWPMPVVQLPCQDCASVYLTSLPHQLDSVQEVGHTGQCVM